MSDLNEGRHPFSPRSNSKVVPPHIPPPRKESLEAENVRLKTEVERLKKVEFAIGVIRDIIGDHFGRHYYYKIDYAMRGETLKTHE